MVSDICCGKPVSNTSMSLEKRARIRPWGVVSKNTRGARIIPASMVRCMARAANQQPNWGARSQKNEANAAKTQQLLHTQILYMDITNVCMYVYRY